MKKSMLYLIILSSIFGIFFSLFYLDYLRFSLFKVSFKKSEKINIKNLKNKLNFVRSVWINSKNNETSYINLKISDTDNNLTDYLDQYSKFIYQESKESIIIHFNSLAKNNSNYVDTIIIDLNIENQNTEISISDEFNLQKSIFLSLKEIFPKLKKLYFYSNDLPFEFKHITNLFNEEILEKSWSKENLYSNKNLKFEIIPLFNNSGNKVLDVYEKNIFQKLCSEGVSINNMHFPLYTENWIKEINQIDTDILIFITIKEFSDNYVRIFLTNDFNANNNSLIKIINENNNKSFKVSNKINSFLFYLIDLCNNENIKYEISSINDKNLNLLINPSIIIEIGTKNTFHLSLIKDFYKINSIE